MIIENIRMAQAAITANKTRSLLTILGIVIGIAAVISMLSIGKGAQLSISSSIEKMGTNLLMVRSSLARTGMAQTAASKRLTIDDAEAVTRRLQGIAITAVEASLRAQVKYGGSNTNTSIVGVSLDYFKVRNYELKDGDFFSEKHLSGMLKVCVIGKTAADNLGLDDPVGEKIRINRMLFTIIGTYKERGSSGFGDDDDQIFVPVTTAQRRLIGDDNIRALFVSVLDKKNTGKAEAITTATIRKQHKLGEGKEDDFMIRSQLELLDTMNSVSKSFTLLLGSIALISLLVGGIGIMNILLVSVTERTKEIGIRKAIGAYESDILLQFLIEAVVLCLIGGIVGIAVGIGLARVISLFTAWPFVVSGISIVLAVGVSFATGIFFGYYPARKAARLKPVDALRYE